MRQMTIVLSVALACATGCRQEDQKRWDDFWQGDRSGKPGGALFGRSAGDVEEWTIECNAYEGPNAAEMADRMAAGLKRLPRIKAELVRVEQGGKASRVFYGSYKLKYVEAKTDTRSQSKGDVVIQLSDEIKRDLQYIKGLALGDQYPFFSARAVPRPIEDVGPPEWDLRNAKGVYTLNVGVTYNTPTLHNYKQAAVEWVKALREEGHEAYYYHSPDKPQSSICIGTFGADALVDTGTGKTGYSPVVNALRKKESFEYNLENGAIIYRRVANPETGKMERVPNFSFLVKIPRSAGTGDDGALP